MLKSLFIKNYALIDSLEMDFESGFSVITGETGAGKSIILGALSLILGQRADIKALKPGESKCIIEGVFDVSAYNLKEFCDEIGIEYDPKMYILRREILSTGKSRAFINDSPVSLTELKELGGFLIDIHSQHQNLMLGDTQFQLQVVDCLAKTSALLREYKDSFLLYKKAQKALDEMRALVAKSKDDEEFIRFQYETLADARLQEGEQEDFEQELSTLNHAEDIKSALYKVYNYLASDDSGIVSALKDSVNTVNHLTEVYQRADEFKQRLETAYIDLKDLSSEIEKDAGDIEFDPERLIIVQERLDQIYTLQQKHKVSSVEELLNIQKELEIKLENLDSSDQKLEEYEKDLRQKQEKLLILGQKLTNQRKKAVPSIQKQLIEKITYLGMPNVRFECKITPKTHPDVTGLDDLEFLFSANKNMPLQPVAEVASGGEISRVMLCLKSMIAGATALPTIIFDEVDTGVSGEVADKMGQIMKDFGQNMQVIAITHLPQIAAKGKEHYFVYKADSDTGTSTNLKKLTDNERIQEIAQMLSGSKIGEAAIENAKEMLNIK